MENFKDTLMDLLEFMGWATIIGMILFAIFIMILVIIYLNKDREEEAEDEKILYDKTPYSEEDYRW